MRRIIGVSVVVLPALLATWFFARGVGDWRMFHAWSACRQRYPSPDAASSPADLVV
jgi:hypothetical protein